MIPKSNEIRFETSTFCNYNCVMCARECFSRKKELLDYDTFKHIIDIASELKLYKVCTFAGFGEPLTDVGIKSKIMYAKEMGFKTLLLTNGSLLTPDLYDGLSEYLDSVRISMYANTKETFGVVHGCDNKFFSILRKNINYILSNKKLEVILNYIDIEGINDSETKDWINYWEGKVDLVEVWKPHNWGTGKNYRQIQSNDNRSVTCGRPFSGPIQVQADGTINACCFDFNGETTFADLKKQTIEEAYNNEKFIRLLKCHTEGCFNEEFSICSKCDQRNTNKDGIMLYNSKYSIDDRINKLSTSYENIKK